MQFLTVRELSKSPKTALAKLDKDRKAIITNNGKPQALMLKIDEDNFEQTLAMIEQMEFGWAINKLRSDSIKNGTCNMTLEEINAEIKAAREERKKREYEYVKYCS